MKKNRDAYNIIETCRSRLHLGFGSREGRSETTCVTPGRRKAGRGGGGYLAACSYPDHIFF